MNLRGLRKAGDNLLSHRVAPAVPSAPEGLTSVFGMGTGGTPRLSSPAKVTLLTSSARVQREMLVDAVVSDCGCRTLLDKAERIISTS